MNAESPDEYPSTSSTPLGRRGSYKYGKGMVIGIFIYLLLLLLLILIKVTNIIIIKNMDSGCDVLLWLSRFFLSVQSQILY